MKATKVMTSTAEEINAATDALKAVHDKMTFVQPLTREQRDTLPRLGLKSVEIIGKRLEAAGAHRDSLPSSFDYKQFEREAALAVSLGECQRILQRMLEDVQDTIRVLGPGALKSSKAVFGHLKVAATSGGGVHTAVPGLSLRQRASRKTAAPGPFHDRGYACCEVGSGGRNAY
jgi:hypothetical protein